MSCSERLQHVVWGRLVAVNVNASYGEPPIKQQLDRSWTVYLGLNKELPTNLSGQVGIFGYFLQWRKVGFLYVTACLLSHRRCTRALSCRPRVNRLQPVAEGTDMAQIGEVIVEPTHTANRREYL